MSRLGRSLIGGTLIAGMAVAAPPAPAKYRPCTWGAGADVATDAAPRARVQPMRWGCRGPVFEARATHRGAAWLTVAADKRRIDVRPLGD